MTIELDGVNNTLKTDKIEPQSGTALQVGASGDTITLPSGATLTIAGTINASTGTATGFGAIDWQTSDIKTSTFTAVAGKGYIVNTTGGAVTVNLPAGTAGNQIGLVDYAGTWDTNNVTLAANGSEKIQGDTTNATLSREREAVDLLYVDSTQGWLVTSVADQGVSQTSYVTATGGTITTSGDYKIHSFLGDGTFTVTCAGNAAGSNTIDYLIVAGGGGGGGGDNGGGAGAGGFRQSYPNPATGGTPVSASPGAYAIVVGGGGAANTAGNISSGFSVTSAGGGKGATASSQDYGPALDGGSGGGTGYNTPSPGGGGAGGAGNIPSVSPPQGQPGGTAFPNASLGPVSYGVAGGGGHSQAGSAPAPGQKGGPGGDGTATTITGSSVTYAGGGGGSVQGGPSANAGQGGAGGGAIGAYGPGTAPAATANTGGGGGGADDGTGGAGGSGIVVVRYKYQN